MDLTFLILVLILLTIGLIMLFSASYANAYYLMGNSFHYISRQMAFAVVGVIAMLAASKIDYHFWRRFAIPMMALSIVLLLVVFAMPPINHAHRWIFIGSSFNFQPSEVAKFAVVLLFSHLIDVNYQRMHKFEYGILPFGAILGVLAVLLIAEPHLSGTILIVGLGVIMMIVGGIRLSHLFLAGGAGGTALILLVLVLGKWDRMMGRIEHWLNPFLDPRGEGFQTIQSLYAIGSGGLLGSGIGNSRQKYLYLPEPQNDFIFSIVCEELGLIGAAIIIILFALLLWRGFVIALRAKDKFGCLMAVGLTAQVGLQTILNIAVVTNTVPNTGIGLPFFSYGGTALMMLLAQMGIVLSISRQSSLERE
ncbi:putative lipid II flippase FtsW [Merdimmobilis hominis]|uniref:Probable peptidoglycan glycosyltransferase FtsW n=1 Tax=uncultured Anaerotruncus sp. TaxID=905011 RepID=A0A6N2T132_9FIRM|nr:putative lipid II flippase FtsW [Merdimmobilis hominis]MCD4835988.1 putative lipid II flippase FtsW [Merdimmobilis hominis]